MAEEEKDNLEEKENQEAGDSEENDLDDAEGESEDDEESGKEKEEERSQEDDSENEESEYWDDDEEYLRHLGISDDIKTIEELAEEYKRLRTRPKPEEEAPLKEEKPSESQPIFKRNMLSSHVEDMVKRGVLGDEKVQQSYRSMARLIDDAMNPLVDQMENNTNLLAGGYLRVVKTLREDSWRKFRGKHKNIKREKLDKYMNEFGLLDYRDAYRHHVMQDPEAFGEFTKTIGQKDEGNKKFRPRRSSIKGGKQTAAKTNAVWKPYLIRTSAGLAPSQQQLDTDGLAWNRLTASKQNEIATEFLKYQEDFLSKQ